MSLGARMDPVEAPERVLPGSLDAASQRTAGGEIRQRREDQSDVRPRQRGDQPVELVSESSAVEAQVEPHVVAAG